MPKIIERVKLYKSGKVWVSCLVTVIAAGAFALPASVHAVGNGNEPTAATGTSVVQSLPKLSARALPTHGPASAAPLVTTKDTDGNYSVDPSNTAKKAVTISNDNIGNYFDVKDKAGTTKTFNGKDVTLTNGQEPTRENGKVNYDAGIVLMLAKQQIDFTSDFALDVTITAAWDGETMGGWLGGDGSALFFEPLSQAEAFSQARSGYYLGLSSVQNGLSFNLSTNAMSQIQGATKTNHWYLYDSTTAAVVTPKDGGLTDLGIDVGGNNPKGSLTFTYKMRYTASDHTLNVTVTDANGNTLKTWSLPIDSSWIGKGYTLGVSAVTAESHAAYSAEFNSYTYTPASSELNITSSGLPATSQGPSQSGIKAIAGDIIAFYPEGTTAPTTDADGQTVTAAYAVPAVDGYVLKQPQYITIQAGNDNTINLQYALPATTTVHYVDQNGKQLQPAITLNGYVGDPYTVDTTANVPANYEYVGTGNGSAPTKGQFTANAQTITLVYKEKASQVPDPEKAGDLTIRYVDQNGKQLVDQNGKQLKADTTQSGYIGNGYAVTAPTFANYDYVGIGNGSAPTTGQFTANAQIITLVYKEKTSQVPDPQKAGDLTIRYVDQNGKQLKADTVQSGYVGNGYDVTAPTLSNYDYVGLDTNSAPLKGQFTNSGQTITLVYKKKVSQVPDPEKAGDLTIRYVDQNGKQLKADTVQSGYIGNGYAVTAPTFTNYDYVGTGNGSAPTTGQFTANAQIITLVYKEKTSQVPDPQKAGDLTIRYVDQNGKQLKADTTQSGYIGNGYAVTAPTLANYDYVGTGNGSAPTKGQFTANAQIITLVYKEKASQVPEPEKAGDLTIRYVDQNGKQLKADTTQSGYIGNGYAVTAPTLANYDYVGTGNGSAPTKGQFTANAQIITLVYKEKASQVPEPEKAGNLTVRYVDQNGKQLKADTTQSGYIGNGYAVTAPTLANYDYVGTGNGSAPTTGQFTANAQIITLVYKEKTSQVPDPQKAGDLTIRYVDQNGKQLKADTTQSGYIGNGYAVTAPTLANYDYVGTGNGSAPTKGQFTANAQIITLVYKEKASQVPEPEKAGDLTIKYVDQNGKPIKAETVQSGYVGNGYSITAPALKGYAYAGLGQGSAALNGTFTAKAQTITLVYHAQATNNGQPTPTKGEPTKSTTTTVKPSRTASPATGTQRLANSKAAAKSHAAQSKQAKLPQTGEQRNLFLEAMGLLLLSLVGIGSQLLRRRAR